MKSASQDNTKNNTKETILETARVLFNQHGVESITVRHIAQEIGISHGNLCYHFPRKENIIFTLYRRVVEGMSAQVALWKPEDLSLALILTALHQSYALQYHYKFLMVDFVNIMRRIPEIREDFRQIFTVRKEQFAFALVMMQHQGVLRKDIPPKQLEYLLLQNYLLGDFWMSESEILYDGEEQHKPRFYADIAAGLMFPYLTAKGRKEYARFYEELDKG
ncbi:MAG: TetR/AcrR family transcriptional regulator [Candidatus Kapabacteria bacterium]|jgi:AcrR family transcriptional regulator|nr:TetR/AcrR family transcriptional regulator [Candidatus Kapabacteria bacterium]